MTSPQEGNSDVFAPVLATASIEDNLTATEPQAEIAISELEPQQPTENVAQNNVEEDLAIKQDSSNEQKPEMPNVPEDGMAGSNGAGQDIAPQFANHYPQEMMGGLPNAGLAEQFTGGALDILAGLTSNTHHYQFFDPYAASFPPMMDGLPAMQSDMGALMIAQQPYLDPSPNIHELPQHRVSAFAKLEFEDGDFYISTYSIILGRDLAAHRAAVRR